MLPSATALSLKVRAYCEDLPVLTLTNLVEVIVRTTHLLLKLEEAQRAADDEVGGKTIVFGSVYRRGIMFS